LIGWDCTQRRNLGFVLALDMGADLVATVDDDNIPKETWGTDILVGRTVTVRTYEAENGCFDPVGAAGHDHLWHRGYPLQLLRSRDYSRSAARPVRVDIQADFWDGDPDIDAVCRLEHAPAARFDPALFPFASTAIAPFNSQNTLMGRDALARYFVLPAVGRMNDIWAAFHMQALGFTVVFGPPTVYQDRHAHDLTRDLADEVLGYKRNAELVAAINTRTYRVEDFWPERARLAYDAYLRRVAA